MILVVSLSKIKRATFVLTLVRKCFFHSIIQIKYVGGDGWGVGNSL